MLKIYVYIYSYCKITGFWAHSARVPLKNRFRLAIIVCGKCKNANMQLSPAHLQIYSSQTFQRFFHCFHWIPLVILGYCWLSTIQIYVKFFAHLQSSVPAITKDNQGKPVKTTGKAKRKGSQR